MRGMGCGGAGQPFACMPVVQKGYAEGVSGAGAVVCWVGGHRAVGEVRGEAGKNRGVAEKARGHGQGAGGAAG